MSIHIAEFSTLRCFLYDKQNLLKQVPHKVIHAVGSKSFRPDVQKPRQMENAVRDI